MRNQFNKEQNSNLIEKKEISLPIVALCLSLVPFIIAFSGAHEWGLPSFVVLLLVMSPIAGLLTGIVSLSKGKKQIGIIGLIFSIIAIVLPAAVIIFIIVFFIGASMGLISLM